MSISRSQLEALDPGALGGLADRVGSALNTFNEQVDVHDRIARTLPAAWRGSAADGAADDVADHLTRMRSNVDGVSRLRTVLTNAGDKLASSRANVLDAVSRAESNGFRVGDDWSVTDGSNSRGMQRAVSLRDAREQIRNSLSDFTTAERDAAQQAKSALDGIKPVDVRESIKHQAPGGGADDPRECHPGKMTLQPSGTVLDSCQVRNAKIILCTGKALGMDANQMKIALMAAWGESQLHNLGDANLGSASTEAADRYDRDIPVKVIVPDKDGRPEERWITGPIDPANPRDPYWQSLCRVYGDGGITGVEPNVLPFPQKKGMPMLGHFCHADTETGAGLFQQHPSDAGHPPGFWGTTAMIMDPMLSATQFYVGYGNSPGLRNNYSKAAFDAAQDQGAAAETIIRNIHHPKVGDGYYSQYWPRTNELFNQLGGQNADCSDVLNDANRKKIHDQAQSGVSTNGKDGFN